MKMKNERMIDLLENEQHGKMERLNIAFANNDLNEVSGLAYEVHCSVEELKDIQAPKRGPGRPPKKKE